jgi:hypothetical protein
VQIPSSATMLTGGVGYSYGLGTAPSFSNNTQPLTQTNVTGFPYTANSGASGGTGGLIVPAPDVWKVANGYTGRRPIVDTAKCDTCHAPLGVSPTFHAGQRNDGPTCSFCHTPNRTSSGWSASGKNMIHSIHAGNLRSVPFTWHASSATDTFAEVTFPGPRNNCTACHVPGGYDFTAPASSKTSGTSTIGTQGTTVCTVAAPCSCSRSSPCVTTASGAAALTNGLESTVGTGTYDASCITNPTGCFQISPYVDGTGATNYGAGFSFAAATGTSTAAAPSTLVISPITAACAGCHDGPVTVDHMQAMGGDFYAPRSTALASGAPLEQCMICHGQGAMADINVVHQ